MDKSYSVNDLLGSVDRAFPKDSYDIFIDGSYKYTVREWYRNAQMIADDVAACNPGREVVVKIIK